MPQRGGRPGVAGALGVPLKMFGQDFPREVGDAPLVGKGELPCEFLDGHPGDVHCFLVGIVLDGEFAARGAQQVMVHGLVHAVPADSEPVVDAAKRRQDVSFDAGFLGNLANCRLLVVLFAFRMPLRQAPLQPSAPVKAGNDCNPEFAVGRVHHHATGADFLNGGERGRGRVLGGRDVGTDCRWQRWICPPAGSARYGMGHEVHSNDSCPFLMTGT